MIEVSDAPEKPDAVASPPSSKPATFDQLWGDQKRIGEDLADIKRREIFATHPIMRETEQRLEGDRTIAKHHFDAAGMEPSKLQPFDSEREWNKLSHSPLEAFGSFGSSFGIIASLFTRAPMENALNASASAMNAIHANDEKAYQRSYTSWKDNMELVQKRFNMQNTLYNEAIQLMNTDLTAGKLKLQNAAVRFGDMKTMYLLENGMDKELIDMTTARLKQFEAMTKASDALDEHAIRRSVFDRMEAEKNPNGDPQQRFMNWNYAQGVREPWQQQLMTQFLVKHQGEPDLEQKAADYARSITTRSAEGEALQQALQAFELKENRKPSPEELQQIIESVHRTRGGSGTEAERFINKRAPELMAANPEMTRTQAEQAARQEFRKANASPKTPTTTEVERYVAANTEAWLAANPGKERHDAERALRQEFANDRRAGGGAQNLTTDRQRADDIRKAREKWKDEGKTDEEIRHLAAALEKQLKGEATGPTPNRRDQLASTIVRMHLAEQTISKAEALMKRYNMLTGLGGTVTRPLEVVSNWFRSNWTDRAQFASYIHELQEWAPRLLNDTAGRPLASEASHVNNIVAGLSMGDTTANTAARLYELQKLLNTMRKETTDRYRGTWEPPAPGIPGVPGAKQVPNRWELAPAKKTE